MTCYETTLYTTVFNNCILWHAMKLRCTQLYTIIVLVTCYETTLYTTVYNNYTCNMQYTLLYTIIVFVTCNVYTCSGDILFNYSIQYYIQ